MTYTITNTTSSRTIIPTEEQLEEQYGYWGLHPDYPLSDWQAEVINNETRYGYWRWVEARLAEDLDSPD